MFLKYRKKVLYGKVREDVQKKINKSCKYKNVKIIVEVVCIDHVHLALQYYPS